jgi:hypothetical protein
VYLCHLNEMKRKCVRTRRRHEIMGGLRGCSRSWTDSFAVSRDCVSFHDASGTLRSDAEQAFESIARRLIQKHSLSTFVGLLEEANETKAPCSTLRCLLAQAVFNNEIAGVRVTGLINGSGGFVQRAQSSSKPVGRCSARSAPQGRSPSIAGARVAPLSFLVGPLQRSSKVHEGMGVVVAGLRHGPVQ